MLKDFLPILSRGLISVGSARYSTREEWVFPVRRASVRSQRAPVITMSLLSSCSHRRNSPTLYFVGRVRTTMVRASMAHPIWGAEFGLTIYNTVNTVIPISLWAQERLKPSCPLVDLNRSRGGRNSSIHAHKKRGGPSQAQKRSHALYNMAERARFLLTIQGEPKL